eukprot:s2461_g3.t1
MAFIKREQSDLAELRDPAFIKREQRDLAELLDPVQDDFSDQDQQEIQKKKKKSGKSNWASYNEKRLIESQGQQTQSFEGHSGAPFARQTSSRSGAASHHPVQCPQGGRSSGNCLSGLSRDADTYLQISWTGKTLGIWKDPAHCFALKLHM